MTPNGRDKPGPSDDRSFAELIAEQGDVVPIPGDPAVRRSPGAATSPRAPTRAPARQPMLRPNADEPLVAHRSFVRRRRLRELRAGAIRPDRALDLHGLDRRRAEKLVHETVRLASRAGERCVLVVAGRGRHSTDGVAVLRDELPRWLCDPALERFVVAFAPAIPADGGRGALYVLLA
jgi:DNA-nicking Smr family endonuclease